MRVRVGFGPSGEAASERRAIEIPDVFADDDLEDWQEVANELGFRSLVALPLQTGSRILGTVTFYFAEPGACGTDRKGLLRLVADQMAATAEKAALIDSLRRANAALTETNAELERQYVAVLEARRAREAFLSTISHELRTPLNAVLGGLAILEEGISGPLTSAQRSDIGRVKGASGRLLRLIDDLLELSTLRRDAMHVDLSEFDAGAPLRDAAAAMALDEKPVTLSVDVPSQTVTMRSDRAKVQRILASLLDNAIKFTEEGEVVATLESRDGVVVYRVRDTGIGVPESARETVFEEFRQVDDSRTRTHGGSGLGLTLARGLARALGGDVQLRESTSEGSTFVVELPRHELDSTIDSPLR
jgi:signal transduction histidine kinase